MSENSQDQINSKDFLIGTLIGGIVGASVALLWTPKTGRELRTNINEQAHLAKEKSGWLAENAKEKGEWLAENAKQKTTVILDKVKNVSASIQMEDNKEDKKVDEQNNGNHTSAAI